MERSSFLILTLVLNGDGKFRYWRDVFRLMQSEFPGRPARNGIIHPVSQNEVRTIFNIKTCIKRIWDDPLLEGPISVNALQRLSSQKGGCQLR